MAISLFNNRKFKNKPLPFKEATISDFSGGLNGVDNDITMKTKYAVVSDNMQKGLDGSQNIRYGTGYRWNVTGVVTGSIVNCIYFNKVLVVVTTTGQVATITDAGVITKIWDSTIAAALPGSPSGWSTTAQADFHEFKGELTIQNGVDKPILLSKTFVVTYLQDLATGSNINTPIGKYGTTVGNFVAIAGIAAATSDVYISSSGTSGVFVGDPAPNDGIIIPVGSFAPETTNEIIGLSSFRNNLFVFFENAMIVITLGIFVGTVHSPDISDVLLGHGILSYRTTVVSKTDFLFADTLGVQSARKNSFGLIDTKEISELINPLYQKTTPFSDATRLETFSVLNKLERRMFTFVPNGTDRIVWSLVFKRGLKNPAWSKFLGWSWVSGCSSEKGRTFFTEGSKIFQYGNDVFPNEDFSADYTNDHDGAWLTATSYVVGDKRLESGLSYICLANHTSGTFATDLTNLKWELYLGEAIAFDWELPWTDLNRRAAKKGLRFLMLDTGGTATFNVSMFVDKFYKDENGNYDPGVTLQYVGGDSGGFGNLDQPFGGGRRTKDERPWGMPVDFKVLKLRIHGSTKKPLNIFTMTFLYMMGTVKR